MNAKDATKKPLPLAIKAIVAFHLFFAGLWLVGQTGAIFRYDLVGAPGVHRKRSGGILAGLRHGRHARSDPPARGGGRRFDAAKVLRGRLQLDAVCHLHVLAGHLLDDVRGFQPGQREARPSGCRESRDHGVYLCFQCLGKLVPVSQKGADLVVGERLARIFSGILQ